MLNRYRSVFLLATSKARRIADKADSEESFAPDSLKKRFKILRYSLISFQILFFLVAIIDVTIVMTNGDDDNANAPYIRFQYRYTMTLFSIFLVTYLAMFVALVSRLKNGYSSFYEREKHKVRHSLCNKF